MSAEEFLKSKGNGESPYGEVIWNYDTASNEWLAALLEEYERHKIINNKCDVGASCYIIEASKDGRIWKEQARFYKGQRSRFNDAPFDETIAIKEAEGFKHVRYPDGWIYVRVVIEV